MATFDFEPDKYEAFLAQLDEETRAVHFWNEMWRRGGRDKDARYPPDCLFERLKAIHL